MPGGVVEALEHYLLAPPLSISLLPIPVIGSIACCDQRLNCSLRGSMEPRIEQFSRSVPRAMEPITEIGNRLPSIARKRGGKWRGSGCRRVCWQCWQRWESPHRCRSTALAFPPYTRAAAPPLHEEVSNETRHRAARHLAAGMFEAGRVNIERSFHCRCDLDGTGFGIVDILEIERANARRTHQRPEHTQQRQVAQLAHATHARRSRGLQLHP